MDLEKKQHQQQKYDFLIEINEMNGEKTLENHTKSCVARVLANTNWFRSKYLEFFFHLLMLLLFKS